MVSFPVCPLIPSEFFFSFTQRRNRSRNAVARTIRVWGAERSHQPLVRLLQLSHFQSQTFPHGFGKAFQSG
jgi:hypothetical protein